MELALAILMVLGIFIGIPALIGFTIVGIHAWHNRQVRRVERAKALEKAEGIAKEPTREKILVA